MADRLLILLMTLAISCANADERRAELSNNTKLKTLASGIYELDGRLIWTLGWNCSAQPGTRVWGVLDYPGATKSGTTLFLRYMKQTAQLAVKQFVAFPPVPRAGLTGWVASRRPIIKAREYISGLTNSGDNPARIMFSPAPAWKARSTPTVHPASLRVEVALGGGCTETIDATVHPSGPYLELSEDSG